MEGVIKVLEDFKNVITKGLTNFKKCPKGRLSLEYVETKLELLENDWSSFKNTNTKLHEKFTLGEYEEKVANMYDTTEDTYITYKTLIKATLKSFQVVQVSEHNVKSNTFVKLPRIEIPTFSGKYNEWTTFHDLFVSLVHKNAALDNVQRLHYLKSHLTGEAEQLVRHTPITDANYNQCWDLLVKRYNNKKYLANCILNRLFGQKRMNVESAELLKGMLDTTTDCLNALSNLNVDVSTWDIIIIHIITFKLDAETRKQWEFSNTNESNNELPSFDQFKSFIENRFRALECIQPTRVYHQVSKGSHFPHSTAMLATSVSNTIRCEYCSEQHKLCFCKTFAKQPLPNRRDFVAKNRLCFNCLGSNHTVYDCKKPTTCKVCHKRHHSLLHPSEVQEPTSSTSTGIDHSSPATSTDQIVSCLSTGSVTRPKQVLLATALINAESKTGEYQIVRALLDQGSQACFITEATAQLLNLKRIPIRGLVSGLGENKSTFTKHMVQLTMRSRSNPEFELIINAYVLQKITSYLPERNVSMNNFQWVKTNNLTLADPYFNLSNKIDILLGADVYSRIIKEGIVKSPHGSLIAQNTALGWVLSGTVLSSSNYAEHDNEHFRLKFNVMHAHLEEEDILKKFWEIEDNLCTKKLSTPEETKCEELYSKTTNRSGDGRYIVKLPFRDEPPYCSPGNSRAIAEKRFKSLEKGLDRNLELKDKYTEIIKEYLDLGHMRIVKERDAKRETAVYLPHHAVIREDKSTTRVRIVFNASEKNSNGVSLNDTLMIGPTLQPDLRHIVMKWRVHSIALVADIVKMYRQVRVREEDVIYQRILWRDNNKDEIRDYELITVTFGTASAPYQAVRTLHQLAYDEGEKYPLAAERVLNCFYMDDLMTGCNSVEKGIDIYKQMTNLLDKGGFTLQKWSTNNKDILHTINHMEEIRTQKGNAERIKEQIKTNNIVQNKDKELEIKLDSTIKILGLTWNRNNDTFQYSVNLPSTPTSSLTKRLIISDIARLFDPLGWLAPSVVLAKIFIQRLWLAGVGWDDELPSELIKEWNTYREELCLLTSVRIPRWLRTNLGDVMELHGFCDASKAAYSAVVYLRVIGSEGDIHVSLLVAKTRVAPIRQISIPRLELCGAVLLSKILNETAQLLNIKDNNITAWTDSTIVLAWLNDHPSRWKTFVANRTAEILTTMNPSQWFHVSTAENPADCASRGVMPSLLLDYAKWFSGPSFLKKINVVYKRPVDLSTNLEQSVKAHMAMTPQQSLFDRFSSLHRLLRVIAYCRRFMLRINKGYLQKNEIEEALNTCIRVTQREIFTIEYTQLKDTGYIQTKSSKIKALCPYLDEKGIIRARGRLERSQLSDNAKHPIILPHASHFTSLVVADGHLKTFHGGPQIMANYLRSAYWILGAKGLIQKHYHQCVVCAKQRALTRSQLMGSLPLERCTPARPFLHSGVDYAGPINIRTTKGRGHRSYKGYICLFVCMATRALHLEVVSDMSTAVFLAAFRRFVARRGHCAKIFSDNGTTFVGASRELQQLSAIQPLIAEQLETQGTEWHFIPPHSPNFGGLWEAGVKSTKFHLRRVLGNATLTFEEMSTLLYQIEACLNSRPMSVLNGTDPSEPLPLTPGHFLIGEPLVSVPDTNYTHVNINYLSRWQLIQRILQSFWNRWSQEYLSHLMNRYKWSFKVPEPKIGDIVLIKEDDLPPCRWLLGRITEKHPGDDNITRVVTVRTKSSVIKRPTSKLCILPIVE